MSITEGTVRRAVAPVLVDAMNFPDRVQPFILGQNMGPLIDKVVAAVMAEVQQAQIEDPRNYAYDPFENTNG